MRNKCAAVKCGSQESVTEHEDYVFSSYFLLMVGINFEGWPPPKLVSF